MEVCVHSNTPGFQDISNTSGSSTYISNSTKNSSGDLSVKDLKVCLTESLCIEDFEISTNCFSLVPGSNNKCDVVKEHECKNLDARKSSNAASEKCFSNCAAFPSLREPESFVGGLMDGVKEQEDYKTSETPLKLVSAMKGSREKQGVVPKKLSVTWAPDVYDPTPTSASHVPSSKNQYCPNSGKKYRRNKQKSGGKSSRGSRGKDKKQSPKNDRGTTKFKPLCDDSVVVGIGEARVGIVDFNGVSPDPFCGSSFLKKSGIHLHHPVAEAM